MRTLLTLLVIVGLWFGLDDWRHRSIHPAPGILVAEVPQQRDLTSAPPFAHQDYTLTPRATFRVVGRVLSGERYRFSYAADLIPRDLALGWDVMSDSSVLDQLQISQSNRFYFWRTRDNVLPVPVSRITESSANMHLIAANASVAKVINSARVGQVITLDGQLVDVRDQNGAQMKTSLTRTDTGAGACEILYVEDARIQ